MTLDDYHADAKARELFAVLCRALEAGAFDDLVLARDAHGWRDAESRKAYGRETRARIASFLGLPFEESWDRAAGPPLAWWLGHDLHCTFGADLGRGEKLGVP